MGRNRTNRERASEQTQRKRMRPGAIAALLAVGALALGGMALFNGNARPNRDMQWYMKPGAVEVAAPPVGEGFAAEEVKASKGGFALASAAKVRSADEPEDVKAQPEADGADRGEALPAEATQGEALFPASESEALPGDGDADAPDGAISDGETEEAEPEEESEAAEPEEEPEAVEPEEVLPQGPVTITITAAGDCTFGGQDGAKARRRFAQYAKDYGYDYFFEGVRSIFEGDDLTIVNLEGPLTTIAKTSKKAQFIFKGDPEYVNILTGSSVELCNVANNHSLDYGTEGLKETAAVLDEAQVGYSGYSQAYYTTIKGVRVGSLGFTWWSYEKKDVVAAVSEARKNCDLLIVSMHWGTEYEYDQSDKQEELGRAIIDAGADLVIGTHPHVFQGIERYKGKYIVYSLGNFCFGGNANPSDKRCLIFQQSFSFTPGLGIVQAGIMDEGINIIPAFISSVMDKNDFKPTVMDPENGAKLLKSIARHSKGFTFEDTLWMKDNYMVVNGLIAGDSETGEPEGDGEAV